MVHNMNTHLKLINKTDTPTQTIYENYYAKRYTISDVTRVYYIARQYLHIKARSAARPAHSCIKHELVPGVLIDILSV